MHSDYVFAARLSYRGCEQVIIYKYQRHLTLSTYHDTTQTRSPPCLCTNQGPRRRREDCMEPATYAGRKRVGEFRVMYGVERAERDPYSSL